MVRLSRRTLAAAALLATPSVLRAQTVRATDLLGHAVELPRPARRIVLTQGRHLAVLNLLLPDPVAPVVGWAADMRVGAVAETAAMLRRYPQLAAMPEVGRGPQDIAPEAVVALQPDLVLLSRSAAAAAGAPLLRVLDAAGIPHAVVDFFVDPLRDTAPSLRVLGALLGRTEQAEALIAFVAGRLERVRQATAGLPQPLPPVLMHAHAGGTPCCNSPGRGVFDGFITLAGGHNIGADRIPGNTGALSYEYVLSRDPAVYVATGGSFNGRGGVLMGAGIAAPDARASLAEVIRRERLDVLGAVRGGRAHALWHGANDTPAHILAIEKLARWIHPGRTAGIDADASLAELNERFAAVPMEGTYWIDLAA